MATLRPMDRLQPALLDRLLDDDAEHQDAELPKDRVMNGMQLRAAVLRDLGWLFNSTSALAATGAHRPDETTGSPARSSVLYYGLPPLVGHAARSIDASELAAAMRRAIVDHEPRILPDTLLVEAAFADQPADRHHHQLSFRISGQLWAEPVPLELLLQTDLDLETGQVRISEQPR